MATKDHKVEMWTRNGDKITTQMTADEARDAEELPFSEESNISATRVTPPS